MDNNKLEPKYKIGDVVIISKIYVYGIDIIKSEYHIDQEVIEEAIYREGEWIYKVKGYDWNKCEIIKKL